MAFLQSNLAKMIGAVLAAVAGTLVVFYPPPDAVGVACTVAASVLAALGLVSTGVQPKLPPPPAP
jgi:hypothetical protein